MYRRRRLVDAIRILPFIGLLLWCIPLLWTTDGEPAISTANALVYLFIVWFLLTVLAAISAFLLGRQKAEGTQAEDGAEEL